MKTNSLLLLIGMTMNVGAKDFQFRSLDAQMVKNNSLVSVGLDPDFSKMPDDIKNLCGTTEEKVLIFLKEVIDATAPHCCCFKLQKAFYDVFDNGHALLRETVKYIHDIHPGIPAYIDCKIGDTDNTMNAYMQLLFDDIEADAIVINPYMGDDVFEPFIKDNNKQGIVLIQTSNPKAKVVQELILANGTKLWEEMLQITLNRWNKNNNLMIVLSSNTDFCDYEQIRYKIPQDTPILLAGIGSQGGDPLVLKQLLNHNKRGVIVNSSRGILYCYNSNDADWLIKIKQAALDLKNSLNDIRFQE